MAGVFADTSWWIALTDPTDQAHRRALALLGSLAGRTLITTQEVLVEYLNYFSAWGPDVRAIAIASIVGILRDKGVQVLPQTAQSFGAGFELYVARPDKRYSLTDCISMETMRGKAVHEVLTTDRHFAQEGFVALLLR